MRRKRLRLTVNIYPGAQGSNPNALGVAGGYLFFSANDGIHGQELWISDGTAEGTVLAQDLAPGGAHGSPSQFTAAGENLFFMAYDEQAGYELWSMPLKQFYHVLLPLIQR